MAQAGGNGVAHGQSGHRGQFGPMADPAGLMVEVSEALASQADPDEALVMVLERIVAAVADWGVVRLWEPGGRVRRVGAVHNDRGRAALIDQLMASEPYESYDASDFGAAPGELSVRVLENITPKLLTRLDADPASAQLWVDLGLSSAAFIPMVVGGEPVGSLMLVISDDRRSFDSESLKLIESLAHQCALLVKNTRLVRGYEAASRERSSVKSLLDSVLASAPVATAILDPSLSVMHANDAFRRLANGDTNGHLAHAIPDLADQVLPMVSEVFTTGSAIDRREVLTTTGGDGARRHWQVSVFPVDTADSGRLGVGLFLSDVSRERQIAEQLQETLSRLDLSISAGGLVTWDWDLARDEAGWGPGSREVLGVATGAARSRKSFLSVVDPADRAGFSRQLDAAAETGHDLQTDVRVRRDDGEVRWMEARGEAVAGADGQPHRIAGVMVDVTDRRLIEEIRVRLLGREHSARVEAEAARERLSLLAEAGAELIGAVDLDATLAYVTALLVPRVCDLCVIDLVDDIGELREVALVHSDPAVLDMVRRARHLQGENRSDPLWSIRRAISTGKAELISDIADTALVALASNTEHLRLLRALSPRSAVAVPLVARGKVIGGLTIATAGERALDEEDLKLMESIAVRVALAVDNARLLESRTEVARALQQTLLPPALPAIANITVEARYRAATDGIDIGGDFYDLFDTADGAWAAVIGDVCGKGAGAAAVTGLFRNTVRAVAVNGLSPASVLRATNAAILGQIEDTRFCTAVFVKLVTTPGKVSATLAIGGHPRPLVVRANGSVERIDAVGTLLGVLPDPDISEVAVELESGDFLVLYTDGVTEARRGKEQFGESGLANTLRDAAAGGVRDASEMANRVEAAIDEFSDGSAADDIAILLLRVD